MACLLICIQSVATLIPTTFEAPTFQLVVQSVSFYSVQLQTKEPICPTSADFWLLNCNSVQCIFPASWDTHLCNSLWKIFFISAVEQWRLTNLTHKLIRSVRASGGKAVKVLSAFHLDVTLSLEFNWSQVRQLSSFVLRSAFTAHTCSQVIILLSIMVAKLFSW